jgi:hypothetical protein
VFTPDQLAEILNSSQYRTDLTNYISNPTGAGANSSSNGATIDDGVLDLSGTTWNAQATNFETVHISLATGYGVGIFNVDAIMMPTPTAGSPDANDNVILGTSGNDANLGGSSGSNGDDVLVGLVGDDSLFGGAGNDLLLAGAGNDTLTGGAGNDVLSGGRGADTFVFNSGENTVGNADTILDYSFVEDDKLDLSSLLDAAFGPSSQVSDFVRVQESGSNVVIQVDTTGSADGASWATVATLANYATSNADLVKVYFEGGNHTLSI